MTPEPATARERMADLLDKAAYDCDGADLRADRIVLLAMADAVLADRAGVGGHCHSDDADCCGACHHDLRAQLTTAQATIARLEGEVSDLAVSRYEALALREQFVPMEQRAEQAEARVTALEQEAHVSAREWEERRDVLVRLLEEARRQR